ncbi:PspC domain-containing protein [Oceanivirga salmonicida]|uniref:PspC domain-containing protein n=1 Tax=Oceanivirga salmonicida TaxID=1769291 RepID=UPI00082B75F8|nr:PspC domain-containing protein [Oceanivirga salmonicida]
MKKIYRSKKDRMIFGVCGGLGEYFEVDPSIIRIVWIFSCAFFGLTILPYFIIAVILPEDPRTGQCNHKCKCDENTIEYED